MLDLYQDLANLYLSYICIFRAIAWLLLKGAQALEKGNKIALQAVKGQYLGFISYKEHVVHV